MLVSLSSGTTTTSSGTSQSTLELRTSVSLLTRCGHLTYCFTTGMLHTSTHQHPALLLNSKLAHHCVCCCPPVLMISLMPPLRPMCWLTPAASVSICLQVRFLIIVLKTRLCLQSFCIHTVLPILQQINYCNQIFSYPLTSRWLRQTTFFYLFKFFFCLHYILG